ncbi:MAG TPA: 16S rRNA (adenine(1518)-N(6)/adenine(1519)-N(6))-dimethyltransferase RsmA [Parcubacteria group bacterium]|nr:16S rRNA (adenine(1518)-N(6)/adenine(1519)-N(6))-dimethyltransferase RsmA [Parcubacteria group bacterium]
MYAKKSLGQNFLKSEKALNQIVEAGRLSPSDTVLEIGPGLGALTSWLLYSGAKVIGVEKDDDLTLKLKEMFATEIESGQLTLMNEDILDLTPKWDRYKLIANIPYNITGAILEKFLSNSNQPELMVVLVQKEVAERIIARNSKESILSISIKIYGEPKLVDTVKAGSFSPAPKVDSAILAIYNISKTFFEQNSVEEAHFFKILRAGFASKRKKLSSNLGVVFDKDKVLETFKNLSLSENTRAEDVPLDLWKELSLKL